MSRVLRVATPVSCNSYVLQMAERGKLQAAARCKQLRI
jgi:hypothetical protein